MHFSNLVEEVIWKQVSACTSVSSTYISFFFLLGCIGSRLQCVGSFIVGAALWCGAQAQLLQHSGCTLCRVGS